MRTDRTRTAASDGDPTVGGRAGGGAASESDSEDATGIGAVVSRIGADDALQGALGGALALSGAAKLAGADGQVREFERYGYPQWFRVLTGGVEVAGGFGLLAGLRRPSLALGGSGLVLGTMAGAVYTHLIRVGDPPAKTAPASALFAGTGLLTLRRWRGRRTTGRDGRGGGASGAAGTDPGREERR